MEEKTKADQQLFAEDEGKLSIINVEEKSPLWYCAYENDVDVGQAINTAVSLGINLKDGITYKDFEKILIELEEPDNSDENIFLEKRAYAIKISVGTARIECYALPEEEKTIHEAEFYRLENFLKIKPEIEKSAYRELSRKPSPSEEEVNAETARLLGLLSESSELISSKKGSSVSGLPKGAIVTKGFAEYVIVNRGSLAHMFYLKRGEGKGYIKDKPMKSLDSADVQETNGKPKKNGKPTTPTVQKKSFEAVFSEWNTRGEKIKRQAVREYTEAGMQERWSIVKMFFSGDMTEEDIARTDNKTLVENYCQNGRYKNPDDAAEVYKWVKSSMIESDNSMPSFYVQAIAEVFPKNTEMKEIAERWARVAKGIEYVEIHEWASKFLGRQDFECFDFFVEMTRYIYENRDTYKDVSIDLIVDGLTASGSLHGKRALKTSLKGLESRYVLPAKHVLRKTNELGDIIRTGYDRLSEDDKKSDTLTEKIYSAIPPEELEKIRWLKSPDRQITSSDYRKSIVCLWVNVFRDRLE